MDEGDAYRGTLTQMIAEMDDILDSADMNDPVVADRVGAISRKRMQLEQLLSKGGKPAYLGGIIKQGNESGMLSAQAQGEIGQMRGKYNPTVELDPNDPRMKDWHTDPDYRKKEEAKLRASNKHPEQSNWSDDPSSNEIN